MLTRVLLHMVATAHGIDRAVDLRSRSQGRRRKVQYASIFLVGNFSNGDLLAIGCQHSKIVNLAAAGRIKSSAIEHDGRSAIALKGFDHASVKVVKKRIVIVEAFSHWELSEVSTWNLAAGQELF